MACLCPKYVLCQRLDMEEKTGQKSTKLYSFKPFVFEKCFPREHQNRTQKEVPLPKPRSGHRIVCDESNLYSFGGYNPQNNSTDEEDTWPGYSKLFRELWKYNFASRKWTNVPIQCSLPTELASNAVVLSGGLLMVYGGTGVPFGKECSNTLYVCDLAKSTPMKSLEVSGRKPIPLYGQALVLDDKYMYTVGGTTGLSYNSDVHRLNLRTCEWEEVYICTGKEPSEPTGRYRHELAFHNGKIYILGGGTADISYGFQQLPVLDLENNRWQSVLTKEDPQAPESGYPNPRRCHGCVQLPPEGNSGPHVIISGGYDGSTIYDEVWRLDLSSLQWTLLSRCPFPYPVFFHSAALCPSGRMYTFGGIIDEGQTTPNSRTSDVHAAWVCVPRLAEMCWEALLFYNPELHRHPPKALLHAGLPLEFVRRIE